MTVNIRNVVPSGQGCEFCRAMANEDSEIMDPGSGEQNVIIVNEIPG